MAAMARGMLVGSKLSQPTRACVQAARMLRLPVHFRHVREGEMHSAEFKARNPNSKIPVLLMDDGFTLYESTSIARHLCRAAAAQRPPGATTATAERDGDGAAAQEKGENGDAEADHREAYVSPEQLFPTDTRRRAKVESLLDWYHTTLRVGAAGTVRRQVMWRYFPPEHSGLLDIEQVSPARDDRFLRHALAVLEGKLELPGVDGRPRRFLGSLDEDGGEDFTLADVFAFQELAQLEVLLPDPARNGDLHGAHPRIAAWLARMHRTPYAAELLEPLRTFAGKISRTRTGEAAGGQ